MSKYQSCQVELSVMREISLLQYVKRRRNIFKTRSAFPSGCKATENARGVWGHYYKNGHGCGIVTFNFSYKQQSQNKQFKHNCISVHFYMRSSSVFSIMCSSALATARSAKLSKSTVYN